ncbi:MAG: magnesium transporter [Desulfovibrionaceae bacterium]|nr:magnesium transporter [Desulfovibrionaceae bacterium]
MQEEKEREKSIVDSAASDTSLQNAVQGETDFFHPADMADHLENLSPQEQLSVLENMPAEDAAEALAELDEDLAGDVLERLKPERATEILSEMSPDDAADVLDEVQQEHRNVLLSRMDEEDAEELRRLMSFDADTAGGIMNTEIIRLRETLTADEAILEIRHGMEEDREVAYYAYVVDRKDILTGVLSLRDLMLSRPGTMLRDAIVDQDVITVRYDTDREEVARVMSRYNFMALPVVDYEGRLLGVATYDDIMDIIQDEASEDMLGMVGAGQDETVDTPWRDSVRMRLPWLVVNMATSALSAFVVYLFEGAIADMALLAVLMPMVANQAGNTGQQALAVMIRQLATERFETRKAWCAVLREGKIGLFAGFIMAMIACVGVCVFSSSFSLGLVMSAALLGDMLLGALAGSAIPLIFRAIGRDPAQASSIFLTALTDSGGFFIFLGLASAFLL